MDERIEPVWNMSYTRLADDDSGEHYTVNLDSGAIRVKKIPAIVNVSAEVLMDNGLIPNTREPVKVSRRQRLRWRWQDKRYAARMRLASWVAGFDVTERD